MAMVFAAEGLDGSEKLLLLGYTNWTDPYGYCWPSEERLVDDCGTSRSTVQRTKRKLAKKNLLKSVRRKNSQGEPISNLSRVNLPLLASMARAKATYDDNLIDQITFDDDTQGDPETTLQGTPDDPKTPSDQLTRHFDSYPESNRLVPRVKMTPLGMSQNDSQSLKDPEGISLSGHSCPSGDGSEPNDERETASPEDSTAASTAGEVPAPRESADGGEQAAQAVAMLVSLPGDVSERAALKLVPLVTDAQAAGWTLLGLRSHLARKCDPDRVRYAPAIYQKHLEELPPAAGSAGAHPAAAAPECDKCNGSGLAEDPETFMPIGPCECRIAPALAGAS
ncbi:helix-turn-helix domain-containing protein [Streptomyces sp. NPDC005056]